MCDDHFAELLVEEPENSKSNSSSAGSSPKLGAARFPRRLGGMIRQGNYPRFKRTYSDDEWIEAASRQENAGIASRALLDSHERFEELRIDSSDSSD